MKHILKNAVWGWAVVAFLVVGLQSCAAGKKKLPPETDIFAEENLPEEEEFPFDEGEADPSVKPSDPDVGSFDSMVDEDEYYSGDDENSALISKLRRWIIQGRYSEALKASEGHTNLTVKYYRGITYYHMMFFRERHSVEERVSFKNEAIKLLRQVGYESPNDYFKAKGLLWHAMAVHLNYTSLKKKRLALDSLWRIQTTRLKNTSSYNDSLLYMADIYMSMGYYPQSMAYYKRLARVSKENDLVYDAIRKRFSSASEASRHGIRRVIRKTNPDGKTIEAIKVKEAPTPTTPTPVTPVPPKASDYIDLDTNTTTNSIQGGQPTPTQTNATPATPVQTNQGSGSAPSATNTTTNTNTNTNTNP